MADISMCRNELCPSKMRCFRYRARPYDDFWQSYGSFTPAEDGTCYYFWSIDKEKAPGDTDGNILDHLNTVHNEW